MLFVNRLKAITFLYLFLPVALFLFYWVKTFIGIPLIICTFALVTHVLLTQEEKEIVEVSICKRYFVVLFLLVIASGTGGLVHQSADHIKHNALIHDLMTMPWPLTYKSFLVEDPFYLVYAVAYYLPIGLAGYLFGPFGANIMAIAWTFLGLSLSYLWMLLFTPKKTWIPIVVLLMFSGWDIVGTVLREGLNTPWNHLEWWAQEWQYSSLVTLLTWVPQHFLPGILLACVVCYEWMFSQRVSLLSLYLGVLSLYWSPFVTIGAMPFIIWGHKKDLFKHITLKIPLLFLALVPCFFYQLNVNSYSGELTYFWRTTEGLQKYLLFLSVELGWILLTCAVGGLFLETKLRSFLVIATLILLTLPVYRIGMANDLCMRGSIFSLVVLALSIMQLIDRGSKKKSGWTYCRSYCVGLVLVIASVTPFVELRRNLRYAGSFITFPSRSMITFRPRMIHQYMGFMLENSWKSMLFKKGKGKQQMAENLARELFSLGKKKWPDFFPRSLPSFDSQPKSQHLRQKE